MTNVANLVDQHTVRGQDFLWHKFADHRVRCNWDAVHPIPLHT